MVAHTQAPTSVIVSLHRNDTAARHHRGPKVNNRSVLVTETGLSLHSLNEPVEQMGKGGESNGKTG